MIQNYEYLRFVDVFLLNFLILLVRPIESLKIFNFMAYKKFEHFCLHKQRLMKILENCSKLPSCLG